MSDLVLDIQIKSCQLLSTIPLSEDMLVYSISSQHIIQLTIQPIFRKYLHMYINIYIYMYTVYTEINDK